VVSVQTIIVAAISGLAGSLLGTWLTIRHERTEAYRTRLIEAADDLATGLLQASIGLRAAYKTIMDNGFVDAQDRVTIRQPGTGDIPEAISDALQRSTDLNAEAQARQARVALLFGPVSPADRAATMTMMALNDSLRALEAVPVPDLSGCSERHRDARRHLTVFTESAQQEIKARPWYERRRAAVWVRQHWRFWR
jgi:hypothetical protein